MAVLERFKRELMYGLSAKKMALVERFKHYKGQWMDCPPKKVAIVERWLLLEVRLRLKQVSDHGHENKLKIIKFSQTFLTSFFLTLLTGIRTRSRTAKGILNFRPVNSSHG